MSIQLDKLPPPDVVEKLNAETIYAIAKDKLKAAWPAFNADVESDPINKLLQVLAYIVMMERQRKNDDARACFLATATKADLDNWAANLGTERLLISPAIPEKGIAAIYESDDDLRDRCRLAPDGFSVAGPDSAYEFLARSASGEVLSAKVSSPSPGRVVISLLSREGDGSASPELIAKVQAALSARTRRPLGDAVTVKSADIVAYELRAILWCYEGPDPDIAMDAARKSLAAYLKESRKVGRDITLSGIYAALKVAGIQDVELLAPLANIVVDNTQAAFCREPVITYGGIRE
jgi:phage-related baseplate assembly protein